MDKENALNLLSLHSGRSQGIDNPKWSSGFLGSLRGYNGKVNEGNEENFIEIMECLKSLEEEFKEQKISRDLMADIFGIFYYTNLWIGKNGMLEDVLSEDEKNKLDVWMKIYSYAIVLLLDYSESGFQEAFFEYNEYLKGYTNYN